MVTGVKISPLNSAYKAIPIFSQNRPTSSIKQRTWQAIMRQPIKERILNFDHGDPVLNKGVILSSSMKNLTLDKLN